MQTIRSHGTLPAPLVLFVVGMGVFVAALDQTVVVTALPSVMLDLKIPVADLDRATWIITAYLLGYTVAMPLIGRLADVYGYPRIYQASLVAFALGSLLVAVSDGLTWTVAARVVQALGGGATIPIGIALASNALSRQRRGLALGIVGAAAEAGSMLGPAYGGAIIAVSSWRWIFWLNLPLSGILFLALFRLPNRSSPAGRVDYLGGVLLLGILLSLSLALSRQELFSLSSAIPFLIGAPALVLTVALVVVERRSLQPLLAPFLFRSLAFLTANLTQLLVGISLIIALVTVPLMANTVMGKDPLTSALWLLRMTGAIPLGGVLGGLLLSVRGIRTVTVLGLAMVALGLLLVSTWNLDVAEPWLTLHLVIAGLGFGLVIAPIMAQALNAVHEDYHATTASLVTVSRMLGMTLGLAALSAWGVGHFQTLTAGLDLPLPQGGEAAAAFQVRLDEYNAGLHAAGLSLFHNFFQVAAGAALTAILPALVMRSRKRSAR